MHTHNCYGGLIVGHHHNPIGGFMAIEHIPRYLGDRKDALAFENECVQAKAEEESEISN
ncbi:hypothetical protein [uncultured Shewanella sp.]|uniref:hypothetical protein n=1 Tax=uncultured Shewanella sp. TaxID=173975 RepID=UPI002628BEE6|nr:hypothetical protein [uncultured Shewanella sp.]